MQTDWSTYVQLRTEQIPTHLSVDDERELRWYFHLGGPGIFERSSFAAQLRRCELYSHGSTPCTTCGGKVERGEDGSILRERPGSGLVPADESRYQRMLDRERKTWEAMGLEQPSDYPPPLLDNHRQCPTCLGMGWISMQLPKRVYHWPRHGEEPDPRPPIPVFSTCAQNQNREVALPFIDEVDAARLAVIGRLLGRVADVDDQAIYALDAYFGDDGGQLIHLYCLVPAGRKLLRRAHARGIGAATGDREPLSPAQLIESEIFLQSLRPDPNRRQLLAAAEDQARSLFERSCRTWNQVVHGAELLEQAKADVAAMVAEIGERNQGGGPEPPQCHQEVPESEAVA